MDLSKKDWQKLKDNTTNRNEKVAFLKSKYATNTVFELANNFRVQNKNDKAIKYYKQIIESQEGTYQERKSRLEIGGIYLRQKNYSEAEKYFTDLIRKYPKSQEGEAAINEIEKSY